MADEGVERGSLSDLYVAYAPDGIRLAFLLTGDRALAEDLVQDAFVRLVGRLRHLREPYAFWRLQLRVVGRSGVVTRWVADRVLVGARLRPRRQRRWLERRRAPRRPHVRELERRFILLDLPLVADRRTPQVHGSQ